MRIYLDNAATTPIHPEVIDEMSVLMREIYGNPSSIHESGRKAKTIVEDSRKVVARILNASIGEIFFTGSATEANNMILRRAVADLGVERIIISTIEHPCVLNTSKELANTGIDLIMLAVDHLGRIDLNELEEVLQSDRRKTLVSIMHVNNEIGIIQDIASIARMCEKYTALFHTDAVQSIGKINIDLQHLPVDFLSGTSHKFHGPKGVGFMYIKNDHSLHAFISGGGQEREMRSGTENVYGIAGLAKALKLYHDDQVNKIKHIQTLKSSFKQLLKRAVPSVTFIEDEAPEHFIATILSASFPESPKSELITFNLDISGIAASAGSACASGVEQVSHVLEAIHFPDNKRAVRFSFSYLNTLQEIEEAAERVKKVFS